MLVRGVLAGLVLAAAVALPAHADQVVGTRSQLLEEDSHEVRVELDHGDATLTVRRTVHNGGPRHDQAVFGLDVPNTAVATGLRTLGMFRGQPRWFEGELLDAEVAAARYQELTGIGGYTPKDPALLSWRDQDSLALQVFPVAPGTDKTVEYTLHMPMTYQGGRYRLSLPRMGTDQLRARVVVVPAHPLDQLFVDDTPVGAGRIVHIGDDAAVELGLARSHAPRIDGGLGVVDLGDRALVHVDLQLAAKISTVPRNARVIVAIDTSASMDAEAVADALLATRAYLGHFAGRGAQVEVLTFDREVHARHGAFVSVAEALADLEGLTPSQKNGSHVDLALRHAERMFAKHARGKPRRLVLITDAMAREAMTPPRVRAHAVRTAAIVHVAKMHPFIAGIERADEHPWVEVARATGGLAWTAGIRDGDPRGEAMRAAYEEWARPIRIDRLQIVAPGLEPALTDALEVSDRLDEGEGLAATALLPDGLAHVRLAGELWATPIDELILPDHDEGTRWAGLAFGTELLDELDETEMRVLAMRGRVVSPVTSYLAIEPGVRPSTEGLEPMESGGAGGSGFGLGSVGTIGHGGGGGGMVIDRDAFLRGEVRAALDACGGADRHGTITLQTTSLEIVEIDEVELDPVGDAALVDCVRDGVWAISLPAVFSEPWRRWEIRSGGP